ncbi:MAG: hypothetical protein ABIM85_05415 [candidate division WOR-3 bacterium]
MKRFLIYFLFLSSCYKTSYFNNVVLKEGSFKSNFKKVDDEEMIKDAKNKIEQNSYIFKKILNLLSLEDSLYHKFNYLFSGISEDKNKIIIIYFLRLKDPIFSGVRVEFVYNLKNKNFETIYYRKVPYD